MIYKICKLTSIRISDKCVRIKKILSYYELLFRYCYFLQIVNKYLSKCNTYKSVDKIFSYIKTIIIIFTFIFIFNKLYIK